MSTSNQYIINIISQGLGRLVSVGTNLFIVIVLSRTLGAEQFGWYAFIFAYIGVVASFADFGTTHVLAQGISQAQETPYKARIYFGNFLFVRALLLVIAVSVALWGVFLVEDKPIKELLIALLGIPVIASRFFDPLFQNYNKPWSSFYSSLGYSVMLFSLSFGLYLSEQLSIFHFLIAYLAANLLYVLIAGHYAQKLITPLFVFDSAVFKKIIFLALPIGVASFLALLNSRLDTFLIIEISGEGDAGVYNAAYRLLDMGALIAITIATPLIPVVSKTLAKNRNEAKKTIALVVEFLAVSFLPVSILVILYADPIIMLVFGQEYQEAKEILPIFAVILIFILYSLVCSSINVANQNVSHGYWNAGLALTINLALNYLWIPEYGIVGAAYATLISHGAMLGVAFYYANSGVGNFIRFKPWVLIASLNFAYALAVLFSQKSESELMYFLLATLLYALITYAINLVPLERLLAIVKSLRS